MEIVLGLHGSIHQTCVEFDLLRFRSPFLHPESLPKKKRKEVDFSDTGISKGERGSFQCIYGPLHTSCRTGQEFWLTKGEGAHAETTCGSTFPSFIPHPSPPLLPGVNFLQRTAPWVSGRSHKFEVSLIQTPASCFYASWARSSRMGRVC